MLQCTSSCASLLFIFLAHARTVAGYEISGSVDDNVILIERQQRNAVLDTNYKWTNNTIPYEFFNTSYTDEQKQNITRAMRELEANTCLRFVERTIEDDYLQIWDADRWFPKPENKGYCGSFLGRQGGPQPVYLSITPRKTISCMWKSVIQHELLHAIGFDHEHNRADRDQYIRIHWDNVREDRHFAFNNSYHNQFFDYGCPYTYGSIMHYPKTHFSKTGDSITMEPIDPTGVFGNFANQNFSPHPNDYEKINRMYGCGRVAEGHTCGQLPNLPPLPCEDNPYPPQTCNATKCETTPRMKTVWCRKTCGVCTVPLA